MHLKEYKQRYPTIKLDISIKLFFKFIKWLRECKVSKWLEAIQFNQSSVFLLDLVLDVQTYMDSKELWRGRRITIPHQLFCYHLHLKLPHSIEMRKLLMYWWQMCWSMWAHFRPLEDPRAHGQWVPHWPPIFL